MKLESIKVMIHRYLNRDMGVILIYHSVVDCILGFNMWTHMPLNRFAAHMRVLKQQANVIPLTKMISSIQKGKLPKYSVAVTFDDGFVNNFTRAFPVLQHYNIPATIFLSTAFVGTTKFFWPERLAFRLMRTNLKKINVLDQEFSLNSDEDRCNAYTHLRDYLKKLHPKEIDTELKKIENMLNIKEAFNNDPIYQEWLPLNWDQVKDMEDSGLIEFGGHTADHHILSRLNLSEAEEQIKACKNALDLNLKYPTKLWAYPNGEKNDFSDDHKVLLQKYGFLYNFSTIPSYISINSETNTIGRIGIGSQTDTDELMNILSKRDRWEKLDKTQRIKMALKCGLFKNYDTTTKSL